LEGLKGMTYIELQVERREARGKNEARRARVAGKIPAVVYGARKDTVPIFLSVKGLNDVFRAGAGGNSIYLLKMAPSGESRHAMIRELTRDPISRKVQHVDFMRVLMDQKVRVSVEIELTGTARGVKDEGGILDFVTREIEIECLPEAIPQHVKVDVSNIGITESLRLSQIPAPEGIRILGEADRVIVHVGHPAKEEAAPVPGVEVAAAAEPEVIKKGKLETDEDGETKKPETKKPETKKPEAKKPEGKK
jgi:large subunit ribosomal protein L25